MQSVEAAQRAVAARIERLAGRRVPLADARGRVLASDVVAARALPSFDNSAMDGYAARSAELPATLPVAGTAAAGHVITEPVPPGVAIRIFTGAPVPAGLDTVVIQEDAQASAGAVTLPASPAGDNIRRAGEDIAPGEVAVAAGARLGAGELGLLAALGVVDLSVVEPPRVALIATGDELVDHATTPLPGQIVDSSAHMLGAMIEAAGARPSYLGIAKDDPTALAAMIASAFDHDAIITTGGVSVGDRDHVRGALAAAGVELELWKVAMKPGKPFSFGMHGRVPVFGLPGNPVSSFVGFELFVRPALLQMTGAAATARARAPVHLARGYRKQAGRAHYLRATIVRDGERLTAHPHPKQGSAMLTSLIGCNALVELPAEATEIAPNSVVQAILLEPV
jgi:molybdopterin molybdotransferase